MANHKDPGDKERPFLTWRDIKLLRGSEPGKFQARITFRNLKTNFADPEKAKEKGNLKSTLQCVISSPRQVDNLVFSVPHRLLTIALRRGLLDGIATIDELIKGDQHYLIVSNPSTPSNKPRSSN